MSKIKWPAILPAYRITSKKTYHVLFTDEFLNDAEQLGECRYDPPQIVVKNGQSEEEAFSTVCHEIIHAADYEHDIGLTEKQVLKLEKALIRFLRLNKIV